MSMILLLAVVLLAGWLGASLVTGARQAARRDATAGFSRALAAMSTPRSTTAASGHARRGPAAAPPRRRSRR